MKFQEMLKHVCFGKVTLVLKTLVMFEQKTLCGLCVLFVIAHFCGVTCEKKHALKKKFYKNKTHTKKTSFRSSSQFKETIKQK